MRLPGEAASQPAAGLAEARPSAEEPPPPLILDLGPRLRAPGGQGPWWACAEGAGCLHNPRGCAWGPTRGCCPAFLLTLCPLGPSEDPIPAALRHPASPSPWAPAHLTWLPPGLPSELGVKPHRCGQPPRPAGRCWRGTGWTLRSGRLAPSGAPSPGGEAVGRGRDLTVSRARVGTPAARWSQRVSVLAPAGVSLSADLQMKVGAWLRLQVSSPPIDPVETHSEKKSEEERSHGSAEGGSEVTSVCAELWRT